MGERFIPTDQKFAVSDELRTVQSRVADLRREEESVVNLIDGADQLVKSAGEADDEISNFLDAPDDSGEKKAKTKRKKLPPTVVFSLDYGGSGDGGGGAPTVQEGAEKVKNQPAKLTRKNH